MEKLKDSKTINEVYETSNYDQFKLMLGNRFINKEVVRALQESISERGQLSPMIVNEKLEIVDGQHRYHALIDLGQPIKFIVVEGLDIDDVRAGNAINNAWSLENHLHSRVEKGIKEYTRIHKLMKDYDIRLETVLYILAQYDNARRVKGYTWEFKRGKPVLNISWDKASEICGKLHDYKEAVPRIYHSKSFQKAIVAVMGRDIYDHDRMIDQLTKHATKVPLMSQSPIDIKVYLNDIFNYGKYEKNRTNLLTERELHQATRRRF